MYSVGSCVQVYSFVQDMRLCLQRSSIKDDWGVIFHQEDQGDRVLLSVSEVVPGTPAYNILEVGDTIISINDWEVEKIKEPEVAQNLFKAAGNTVSLLIKK